MQIDSPACLCPQDREDPHKERYGRLHFSIGGPNAGHSSSLAHHAQPRADRGSF
ncbi:hypothetical protein [Novosphingobium sp. PhB55]|uniref:hypothetical protein n=1 Tax=Novosphingobium sp. PhB55 TaxID=2485106 RepID=UPI001416F6E2|nr:hypothetical protein [Novosphingobium sp. PhB55]